MPLSLNTTNANHLRLFPTVLQSFNCLFFLSESFIRNQCCFVFSQGNYISILSIVPLKINIQKSTIYKCGSYEGLKMEHCSLYLDEGRSERWRRKWQPTPVFLPGESQRQRSLVGCHLWGRIESDTTEVT